MKRYMPYMIQSTEEVVEDFLKRQIKDPSQADFGGLRQKLIDPKPTVYGLISVVALYCCKDSVYYKSEALEGPIKCALAFIAREQRRGLFDFPSCNFASAPDTSFILKQLFPMYDLMDTYLEGQLSEAKEDLLTIIREGVTGLMTGGFHTPNHRWAIAAALMQGHQLFSGTELADQCLAIAQGYLAEGIDGNEDGEYAERSTGNYNAVVNSSMITLYETTKDEAYLAYVERNLEMMQHYMDPDDTVFTQNSTRQDKGAKEYGYKYFYHYLYMAEHAYKPLFDGAAHKLMADCLVRRDVAPFCLHKLMLNKRLMTYDFKNQGYLEAYRRYFKDSGVYRVRNQSFVYSVLEGKNRFLFMKKKGMLISLKMGISYCDVRNLKVQDLICRPDGCQAIFEAQGWYYKPFETDQGTSDWWAMDHSKRDLVVSSKLKVVLDITESEDGIALAIRTEGYEGIPIRLEVAVEEGSTISNDVFEITGQAGRHMILKKGLVEVSSDEGLCKIGPGFGNHSFTAHYSGEDKTTDQYTIIMTDYTPVTRTVDFHFGD